jgi:hypothetical protein
MVDNPWTPYAEKYVESAMRTIGNAKSTVGCATHIIVLLYSRLLNFISPAMFHQFFSSFVNTYKKKLM